MVSPPLPLYPFGLSHLNYVHDYSSPLPIGQRAGLVFADVLTQLFEEVAGFVERYHHTVDTLYGSEWTRLLIHKLQVCIHCIAKLLWGLSSKLLQNSA